MVGDGRRLATELVVIIARAIQEIQDPAGALVRAAASAEGWSTGPSTVLVTSTAAHADGT